MAKIRVTKEFSFEMAHALWNYDGPCRNIHGHSYKLFVTVTGEPLADKKSVKLGMVIDFGILKRLVNKYIVSRFDHTVVVCKDAPHHLLKNIDQMFEKYEATNYQPTCENLVIAFADILKSKLPSEVSLFSIKLYETETSFAEWHASDNF
ncbi:MAG: 6-carboxytetrahydropterin synthase QueD [Bacteroidetes bacterium]|nr:MAG: 6-carboxytetrahydropterin synthase QueD [Bacteroidota bacterium]